jgi:DNA-binding beta-propeller fold protein YncE
VILAATGLGGSARRRPALAGGPAFVIAALASLAAMLAFACASASALTHRGHEFTSSFGQAGSGPGQFSNPVGVAVDEASGNLYVVDAGNERVEIFTPDGSGGYAFSSEFKVRQPLGPIAVDNSTNPSDPTRGNVYVVASKELEPEPEEHEVIYEYSPAAKEVHKWTSFKAKVEGETEELELEDISGVSVDAGGTLWVYWEENGIIDGFAKQAVKGEKPRLAWEPSLRREPEIESKFECWARPVFAVAPGGDAFYAGYERPNAEEACPGEFGESPGATVVAKLDAAQPTPHKLLREVGSQSTTGVAVDPTNGDVYLDNGSSVGAYTAAGAPIQRFGVGHITGAAGAAVDAQRGDVFVAEPGSDEVAVFGPEAAGPPEVDGLSARNLSPSSAELDAKLDANGLQSEYRFEYGTSDCSTPGACTQLPAGKLTATFGDQDVHVVVEGLSPATTYYYRVAIANTAGSAEGAPSPNTFTTLPSSGVMPDGRAWELVSPADKHGAAPELIAPFRGGYNQAAADGDAFAWLANGPVVAEPEGNRAFEFNQLLSRREPGGWSTASLETPHDEGRGIHSPSPTEYHFFSPDLSRALLQPTEPFGTQEAPPLAPGATEKTMYVRSTPPSAPGFTAVVTPADDTAGTAFGGKLEFAGASADLKRVVFESTVGLAAEHPTTQGIYEWEEGAPLRLLTVLPDGSPAPLELGVAPKLGESLGLNSRHAVSTDGTRVIWSTAGGRYLYMRDITAGEGGQTIMLNAAQGQQDTASGEGGQEVPEPLEAAHDVAFQTASADDSRVLFTDTARLTEDSSLEPAASELQPADLYEFDLTSAPGQQLKGRLTDLTPDASAGHADVLNLIPGASQDASRTYFVANGVLAPGAARGDCPRWLEEEEGLEEPPPADGTCNLYVVEADPAHPGSHVTRFIATLSAQDAADWGAGPTSELGSRHRNLSNVTSRVSPDGRYLAFMSERSLTGYDNRDAGSGEADEEVYLYDAQTQRLLCASCNSGIDGGSWQRPQGVFDTAASGEGFGLLVDRPRIWNERWLAGSIPGWAFNILEGRNVSQYQPRYLSDAGRLYFNSSDPLVAADTNSKEDVYQYEPGGIGSCDRSAGCVGLISSGTGESSSAFVDASEDGHDVFFTTADRLVASDTDSTFDIYDARVCEPSDPCIVSKAPSHEECASVSACHDPSPQAPPGPSAPASIAPSGSGNLPAGAVAGLKTNAPAKPKPLTRAQKLARALKSCKKLKGKQKRHACERRARKAYGGKSKPKKKAKKTATRARHGR